MEKQIFGDYGCEKPKEKELSKFHLFFLCGDDDRFD